MNLTTFPKHSQRLNFEPVTEENLDQLLPVYNSNPFFNHLSLQKSKVDREFLLEELEENKMFDIHYERIISLIDTHEIVGVAHWIIENPNDHKPWLGLLIIHQAMQNKGYGREFIEVLISWLKENGFSSLRLGVLKDNTPVLPFYHSLNFTIVKEVTTDKHGQVIVMEKSW